MTSFNGEIYQTRTDPFGYHRFEDVQVGETYFFSLRHKRFSFSTQVIFVFEEINNLNFVSIPNAKENDEEEPKD